LQVLEKLEEKSRGQMAIRAYKWLLGEDNWLIGEDK